MCPCLKLLAWQVMKTLQTRFQENLIRKFSVDSMEGAVKDFGVLIAMALQSGTVPEC